MSDENKRAAGPNQKMEDTLTYQQMTEAEAITRIIDCCIHATGSFRDKLTDMSHAFARTERFDASRAESILRDFFVERYGMTMNQRREAPRETEAALRPEDRATALMHALTVERKVAQDGEPFWRAYDRTATDLAEHFGITDMAAKTMMREAFQTDQGVELYDRCKDHEQKHTRQSEEGAITRGPDQSRSLNRSYS